MAEIQADKDQLRAEFAMSTRRLEMSVDQLKNRTTSQLAELGKKGDAINRLKIELGEKTATIFALEARDKALRDQLRATEDEIAAKTGAMHDAQRAFSDKQADLAKMMGELDEKSTFTDAQKVEIIALKTQVEALKERLTEAGDEVKAVEDRRDSERLELKAAAQELTAEQQTTQQAALQERIPQFDAVITTAAIPGRPAPKLVTAAAVRGMRPGSVIVDLAAETGGNCELTEPGAEIERDGVTIVGITNLPALMPTHASQLLSRNIAAVLGLIVSDGALALDWDDEIVAGACVTRKKVTA
jgi:alanine dehydrogenase